MIEELEVYELEKNWVQKQMHKCRDCWHKVLQWMKIREEKKIRNKISLEEYSSIEEEKKE